MGKGVFSNILGGADQTILQGVDAAEAEAGGILNVTRVSQTENPSTYINGEYLGAADGPAGTAIPVLGTDSLFNPFYVYRYAAFDQGSSTVKTGVYDVAKHTLTYQNAAASAASTILNAADMLEGQRKIAIENPSATAIIDWAKQNGDNKTGPLYPYPYQLNDFLWCKYYGKIPNNRLVTLRRYPIPVEDNLAVLDSKLPLVPIAQAVTWWGGETANTLGGIIGMTYGLNWDKTRGKADVQDVQGNEVEAEKVLDAIGISKDQEFLRKALLATFFGNPNNPFEASGFDATLQQYVKESWTNGAYWNRVQGPINVIDKTYLRDRGFTFTHKITLNFEYSLRSYGSINPKIAMLDLFSNFMSLTYNRASFWGGAYRYFQKTGYLALGLNNEKMEGGDYVGGLKDLALQYGAQVFDKAADLKKFVDSLGSDIANAKSFEEALGKVTDAAGNSKIAQDITAGRLAELHQKPLVLRALLDGRAVGEWHVTVGNPMDPIAVIGNLCLDSTVLSFSEELGPGDFPLSMKFAVTLEPGRPRAKQDIESMFNLGGGDLAFTRLQEPASAFNSYGEYNSARIASAYGLATNVETTVASALQQSATGTTVDTSANTDKAKNLAEYFSRSVSRAYGEKFGASPILVDYFTDLKTKD